MAQWFLDRMDSHWSKNLIRFKDKMNLMDANFCTTDPKTLNLPKKIPIFYMPNPVDESFETLKNFNSSNLSNDVFFAMSHGVHRGVLKIGKIEDLIETFPEHSIELQKIISRLKDLMVPFQKKWYYTPKMRGSYSIKQVLPALVPELSYNDLEINEGGNAEADFRVESDPLCNRIRSIYHK